MSRIGLIGCVKKKRNQPAAAAELYISALFAGRRRYAERSCDRWFVLSARYGLLDSGDVVEPYEMTLNSMTAAARRAWSERVLDSIEHSLGPVHGHVFEIHAGAAYCDHGLVSGLEARGGRVERPMLGLPIGLQLQAYARR